MKSLTGVIIVGGLVLVTAMSSLFKVPEWEQAIIIQLGRPIRTITEPGLQIKIPFIQNVVRFDKRLLEYDAAPRELLTIDKQQILVDNYSRWRITDPLRFYQSVRSEAGAQSRLDDIIYSALREKIGRITLRDLISGDRQELLSSVLKECNDKSDVLGIVIADVRIKRAELPEKNQQNVFARMITERQRLAKKFRAEGEEEARKIRSTAEKEARIIEANGNKASEIIRGTGDAQSTRLYVNAYNQDPDFYAFLGSLEVYKKALTSDTKVVLTPDSDFLKTFFSGK